ncbi:MAG: YifB family Mg chelatase-like AAA ATPase [Patescibacteria group bacterium]
MFKKVNSAAYSGLKSIGIDVEINTSKKGLPNFNIVGLTSKAVDESEERVKNAIMNSKMDFPQRRITVNLAPADVPKEGSFYDLPIAVGILASSLNFELPEKSLFFGELSLDGSLRHTKGALPLALFAQAEGYKNVFLPKASANEAAVIKGINVYPIKNLDQIISFLTDKIDLEKAKYKSKKEKEVAPEFDMSEILGQEQTKRAAEIAAAGGHNLFMVGSPGSGKTMIARSIPGILPELSNKESLEVTEIYSISGNTSPGSGLIRERPFRAPHHSISKVGLIGGGSRPKPGEVTLAHRGVLFLDEFNEFPRSALEAMRQPLEDGELTISRSKERVNYPSEFMLVASSNPCPCGYLNHPEKECDCTPRQVKRYQKKISGPILDRIDLHVEVPSVDVEKLKNERREDNNETSKEIRKRVIKARKRQAKRFKKEEIRTNAEMKNRHVKKYCNLPEGTEQVLSQAASKFNLSARGYFKMIKVAQTIADLDEAEEIKPDHVAEALQYRAKMGNN